VLLLMLCACATPRGEGRLVQRLAPVKPERWPRPIPVGEASGVEVTAGALSDSEADRLPLICMEAVRNRLGATTPVKAPQWRLVLSSLVVDARRDARGDRMVRVRAVLEIRKDKRPLAVANGLGFLTSGAPSLRTDGVEPAEVQRTVKEACTQAVMALSAPTPPLAPAERAQLRARAAHADGKTRAEAIHALGAALREEDQDLLVAALDDEDPQVRRLAAWGLGELAAADAVEKLAGMAELDADYGVRLEAVVAINKTLTVDRSLLPQVKQAREAAVQQRQQQEAPAPAPEAPEEPSENRVLDVE